MRILLLAVVLSGALCLTPEQCDQVLGDEVEYTCQLHNATITLKSRVNDYVTISCEGNNISCSEIPRFDFASGLPLKSLGVSYCPPSILRCVNDVIAATSLEYVTLTGMTAALTREDVEGLGAVRMLMMTAADAERSVPIDVIKALPSLRELRVGGGDFQLSADVFNQAPPLEYLELSNNNISSIPQDTFRGLKSLKWLNMWQNGFENITTGAFRGLYELQQLSLSSNSLKFIEAGAFADIPKLRALDMMDNMLEILPDGLLAGLEHLENITIQLNKENLTLENKAFSELPALKNVIINYSEVQTLPADLFNVSNNILTIDLKNNKIDVLPSKIFLSLSHLKRLDLSYNKIQMLPKGIFAGLRKLEYLNLDRNLIETLPENLFSGPTTLKEIHMNQNSIHSIAFTTFQGAPNVHTLSLASNKLNLDPDPKTYEFLAAEGFKPSSPFNYLTRLRKLDLSDNEIRTIFYDWESVMTNLEYLDLSRNDFKSIEFANSQLIFQSAKLTVDLRYNSIQHVILDPPTSPVEGDPSSTLLLDSNPINCDCYAYNLRLRLNGLRYATNEPKFILGDARCSSPPSLKGELVHEVPPTAFVCDLKEHRPDNCSSCIAKVATNELILDCGIMPSRLPDVKSPDIYNCFFEEPTFTLNLDQQPEDLSGQNIRKLNLSHAGIEELTFNPSDSLKILDVSHNFLKSIPNDFLNANITLYLADNPFECECWNAENIAALQRNGLIADFAQITCARGDKITQIDAAALCNTWKATIAALGTFTILGILVVAAAIITYRYSHEIIVYMIKNNICRCCFSEIQLDKDKVYDIFISFAHEDLELVQDKLLPKLEYEFNQKVCVHYRDWIVGDMIPTQIVRSVESSRKTLIILSKNFLESDWANLEFSAAHHLALQEGTSRVILILLDESVRKHEKLSDELRAYIATNTYLLWGVPNFWDNLNKALPKVQHKVKWLDYIKHRSTTEKEGTVGLDVQLNSDGKLVNIASKTKMGDLNIPHDIV